MTKTQSDISKPTIHINGTSASDLLETHVAAYRALNAAYEVVSNAHPNARDYYPQGPDAYTKASKQNEERLKKLRQMSDEFLALAEHCQEFIRE